MATRGKESMYWEAGPDIGQTSSVNYNGNNDETLPGKKQADIKSSIRAKYPLSKKCAKK